MIQALDVERLVADRPRDGLDAAAALATAAHRAGDAEAEVIASRAAAWAARELYDHAAAGRYLASARRAAEAGGLSRRLGQVWVTWSAVHLELGDLRAAARDVAAARAAFAPDEPVELTFAEGLVAQKAGHVLEAAAAYRSAVAAAGPDEADVRFKAANNLGEVLAEAGRLDEADAALAVAAETAGDLSRVFAAIAAVNRGAVAVQRGQLATAERHYQRSEELARQAGMPLVEFRLEQVRALRSAGLWPEALARLDDLVNRFDAPGAALLLADTYLLLAEASLRSGVAPEAQAAAREAGRLFARQRRSADRAAATVVEVEAALAVDGVPPARPLAAPEAGAASGPAADADGAGLTAGERSGLRKAVRVLDADGELEWAVAAWMLLGRVEARSGRRPAAVAAWSRAAERAAEGPVLVRAAGHLGRALAAASAGSSRRACAAGLADIEAHRDAVASTELRARLARHGRALTDAALATLPPACPPRMLFRWLEAGRSLGQVASVDGAGGNGGNGGNATLVDDLAALRRLALADDAGPGAAEHERVVQQRRLEDRVRRQAWADAGRPARRRPVEVGDVLDRLGTSTLVSYGLVGDGLVAVSLSAGRARRHDLGRVGLPAAEARSLAFLLRRLPRAASGPAGRAEQAMAAVHASLARLDGALLAPVLAVTGEAEGDVVVVPAPVLATVPWGGLASPGGRPLRVAPSARAWVDATDAGPVACGRHVPAVLVAGPGLPGADAEVREVAGRRPAARVLVGDDASGDGVAAALDGATLAHTACHGRRRNDAPLFSALELADGPFTAYDLERVARLPAVVILAACDAGLVASPDDDEAGDPLGFPSVLLQRGVRAVVAATVPVPDVDTTGLMVGLHDALVAGLSVPGALARARAALDTTGPSGLATSLAFTCFG